LFKITAEYYFINSVFHPFQPLFDFFPPDSHQISTCFSHYRRPWGDTYTEFGSFCVSSSDCCKTQMSLNLFSLYWPLRTCPKSHYSKPELTQTWQLPLVLLRVWIHCDLGIALSVQPKLAKDAFSVAMVWVSFVLLKFGCM
jgi:hypothetical protein